jgi:hypothetical protein
MNPRLTPLKANYKRTQNSKKKIKTYKHELKKGKK